jgi:AraC-like DNA-binding protein
MMTELLFYNVTCVSFFLLAFIAFVNPAKVNGVANRWMGLFFLSGACMLLNAVIYRSGLPKVYSQLIGVSELTRFIMPPALYLSIVQYTIPGSRIGKRQYFYFIPFMVFTVYMLPLIFIPGFNYSLSPMLSRGLAVLFWLAVNLQIIIYWVLSYYKLVQHQKNIQLVASSTEAISLNWLKYLLLSLGTMLLFFVSTALLHIHLNTRYTALLYLVGSLVIWYYFLAQKEIFPFQPEAMIEVEKVIEDYQQSNKFTKQRIETDEASQLKARLENLMIADKLYLDGELNLSQLAQGLGVSVHDLSYLLNEVLGINFFQFVNSYRVEEAKRLMLSDQYKHLNILGIAYSAGFSSKTTFNTAFKKQTGLSPSQFIQQRKSEGLSKISYQ